jgi:hypothetical protein
MSAKKEYPWLAQHKVAKPCTMKWSDMSGDDRKRFCGQCRLNVYNLSAMNAEEAENLLAQNGGRVCTYFYQRQDGTVLTQDCPVGLRQTLRTRGLIAAAAYALLLLFSPPTAKAGEQGKTPAPQQELLGGSPPVMGGLQPVMMGEPAVNPQPSPSPSPRPPKRPRALLGKPAIRE